MLARILVTDPSGLVGRVIMARLAAVGRPAIGLAPVASDSTRYRDDLSDRADCARDDHPRHFIVHPERVTRQDFADACAAAGKPVRLAVDAAKPKAARGPVDIVAVARDSAASAA
jgi:hypothetical protein